MLKLLALFILMLFVGCKGETYPKPKAFLRLDYPKAHYQFLSESCAFNFQKNQVAVLKSSGNCSFEIQYPTMKATIYLTYKPVENNLSNLLKDAQKLTYEHTIKASNIVEQPYADTQNKVYGMFYEVDGNAASQSQFYVTDITKHFLTGAIYFRVKPNFDSIQPAAEYLKQDIRKIMETLRWK